MQKCIQKFSESHICNMRMQAFFGCSLFSKRKTQKSACILICAMQKCIFFSKRTYITYQQQLKTNFPIILVYYSSKPDKSQGRHSLEGQVVLSCMQITVLFEDTPVPVVIDKDGNLASLRAAIQNVLGVAASKQILFLKNSPITGLCFQYSVWY